MTFSAIKYTLPPPSGLSYWTVHDPDEFEVTLAGEYFRHLRFGVDRSTETTKKYAHALAHYFTWLALAGLELATAPAQLHRYVLHLRTEILTASRGQGSPRSAQHINSMLTAIRGFYVWAAANGHVPGAVLGALFEVADDRHLPAQLKHEGAGLRYRASPRHKVRVTRRATVEAATPGDFEKLLTAASNWRDRFLLTLLFHVGLRKGQALGLHSVDMHLSADSRSLGCEVPGFHIHRKYRDDNENNAAGKSRIEDYVPVSAVVVEVYGRYLEMRERIPGSARQSMVFLNRDAQPLGLSYPNNLISRLCKKAGIDHVHPHMLRHGFATDLRESGVELDVLQRLLGHQSPVSTQIYNHVSDRRMRAAVDGLPAIGELL